MKHLFVLLLALVLLGCEKEDSADKTIAAIKKHQTVYEVNSCVRMNVFNNCIKDSFATKEGIGVHEYELDYIVKSCKLFSSYVVNVNGKSPASVACKITE